MVPGPRPAFGWLILKLAQRRVGALPADVTPVIRDLPRERVEALDEALLDFSSLGDLETWLRRH